MHSPAQHTVRNTRPAAHPVAGETHRARNACQGLVSEVVYNEGQPGLTQLLLLPLLQQLGQQSRWQLWLTPQQKLSRHWVQDVGLPLSKVMQVSQMGPSTMVDAMEKALRTGNYSVVVGWLPGELSDYDHRRLTNAAEQGNAIGLIMRPTPGHSVKSGPQNSLKIHSGLYH
ncbi:SOS-induced cell division inhibitor SulA [Shimwellia blattae]|uniref:Cell division inhibitor SulA n=1 Tax=Shimwellia blattae (strain ATCC 29907 / DSM 4481 / JCM 1650 / NBRC 105725 / CDC 9005-74) TaxID=630626 RepID=I2BAK6_SHIBC|nr:SOS-induced cell division inhibitor SulA [Shimwellia blattae]AFJ47560.1 cell division inhibitor [Shimwellia blattae DSM 4481 = NBRC 105725]GAB79862.1 cell division inhibitor SulA [Shimwellia blattae DSM 4481 = NBRC 105725]VDY65059.1 Cell division inhibitor SulA [Shimwellia blattae]VEC23455.1 Cell division inhibitor SulA [Shimwellia blattae]